jgi:ACDE family multidrug resistance protein
MTHSTHSEGGGFFAQPKAVWAVAFAAVVSFMGLGLVDPILPAIAKDLDASPSQVELLFTSYFAVTGVSMLLTSAVASRIGAKRTLLAGLALIVLFSALAGASDSIGAIVGLRAGWGLGNALFIATALSVIIGSASGGVAGAVILYEAALGLGISVGPLLGGELGAISWRGPFFGVAVLMTIGFVATAVLLDKTPVAAKSERTSVLEPLRALRHREVRGSALTSAFYNFGFFTLLAYTPLALGLGAHELGYVFFGWGLMLAIFAVFVAPAISRRIGDVNGLAITLAVFAALLAAMGAMHASQTALIVAVVIAGTLLGIVNALMTQLVMETAPVARPVASAAYSFVRFCGGAIAPFVAGKLAEHVSVGSPFYLGAGMTAIAVGVLWLYRDALLPAPAATPAAAEPSAPAQPAESAPMVVAVGGPDARDVSTLAVPLARARGAARPCTSCTSSSATSSPARTPSTVRRRTRRGRCSTPASPSCAPPACRSRAISCARSAATPTSPTRSSAAPRSSAPARSCSAPTPGTRRSPCASRPAWPATRRRTSSSSTRGPARSAAR